MPFTDLERAQEPKLHAPTLRQRSDDGNTELAGFQRSSSVRISSSSLDVSSVWSLTEQASWPRPEMHAALAANIWQAIASLRHVAGVVVSGALGFGVPGGSVGSWDLLDGQAFGLIVHVRQNLHREAVFLAGAHDAGPEQLAAWRDWYVNEASWLDWALHRLKHPKMTELVAGNGRGHQEH